MGNGKDVGKSVDVNVGIVVSVNAGKKVIGIDEGDGGGGGKIYVGEVFFWGVRRNKQYSASRKYYEC